MSKGYFSLLYQLTKVEFRLRYGASSHFLIWYILNPLIFFSVLYFIFSNSYSDFNFPLYILVGIFHWNFFSSSTLEGMLSLRKNNVLVKKTPSPREIFVFSSVLGVFFSHLISFPMLLFIIFIIEGLHWTFVLIPLIFTIEIILFTSFSLILASIDSYLEDIESVWRNLLFIGFFATPVFYLKEMIPEKFQFILLINPLNYIIEFSRGIFISGNFDLFSYLILTSVSLLIFAVSFLIFKKSIVNVAERL